jgi:uncharacterized SAM-binding protein YcdF (DUF218 family)
VTGARARSRTSNGGRTPTTRRNVRPRAKARRRRIGWPVRLTLASVALIAGLLGWAILARSFAPAANTSLTRFDALVVLGYPADGDGNPTPAQLARVTEAVHEYERGVAPHLILTGGAAHNGFVEAQVMARTAQAQGIPASAIQVEPEAIDTIQNACFAARIMKAHGWRSAEVVSSAAHLPRAALIFGRLPLEWRMHAAPPLEPESAAYARAASTLETLKTLRYLVWSRQAERCEP